MVEVPAGVMGTELPHAVTREQIPPSNSDRTKVRERSFRTRLLKPTKSIKESQEQSASAVRREPDRITKGRSALV